MSVYLVKGKGWRYDFTIRGQRFTEAWFKTKREAIKAENERRKELKQPQETRTDMEFLELVNRRLDHVKAYNTEKHYADCCCQAKEWRKMWGDLGCHEITLDMVERYLLDGGFRSNDTSNKRLRYLRAAFNFGKKKRWITQNPTDGISFLPVEKRVKYVPAQSEVERVISMADKGTQDYLWTIRDTMARVSEVNRLCWDDVDLSARSVVLYTRKKRGGHLTPRRVPMTDRLIEILSRRFAQRLVSVRCVFWHRYWSRKAGRFCTGPYGDRKKIMRTLCRKAGVKYFRFHALRHSGASLLENRNVPIGTIQRILGHENRKTTEIYLHSIGETERAAVAILEGAA